MKTTKKAISLLLVFVLLLGVIPSTLPALASDPDASEFSIKELRVYNGNVIGLLTSINVWENLGTTGSTVRSYPVEEHYGYYYAHTQNKTSFKITSMPNIEKGEQYYKAFLRVTGTLPAGTYVESVAISVSQTSVRDTAIINDPESGTFTVYINEDVTGAHNGFTVTGTLKLTFMLSDGSEHHFFIETDEESNDTIAQTQLLDLTNDAILDDSIASGLTYVNLDWSTLGDVVLAPQAIGQADNLALADLVENTLFVNGAEIGSFQTASDGTTASGIKGPAFTLDPGTNIVEIISNLKGVTGTRALTPTTARASMGWLSTVYIIDGGNGSSEALPKPGDSDNAKIAYVGAYESKSLLAVDGICEVSQNDKTYTVYTTTGYALVNVKLSDNGARLIIDDESDLYHQNNRAARYLDSFVVQCFQGEEKNVSLTVTAASGGTTEFYTVKVIMVDTRPDTRIEALEIGQGATLDRKLTENSGTHYTLTFPEGVTEVAITPELAGNGASYEIEGGVFSADKAVNRITVTNGEIVTVYSFLTRLADGTIPMIGISDETQSKAADLLAYSGWYTSEKVRAKDFTDGQNYWNVFMAAAAGDGNGNNFDFNGAMVYDVSRHKMQQNTDWAASILELVILGRNPYSFQGPGEDTPTDYVAGLEASANRGWANATWYQMAAKAVGVPMTQYGSDLFERSYKSELVKSFTSSDLDINAWNVAAHSGVLDPAAHLALTVDTLREVQDTTSETNKSLFVNFSYHIGNGKDPKEELGNTSNTTGCVFSAIAAANVDPEIWFAVDGQTPLATLKSAVATPSVLLTKDMIIGLGDLARGSNLWSRYALTSEKYSALQMRAQQLGVDVSSMPAFGGDNYGKAYYDLYDAVVAALEAIGTQESIAEARQMRPDVQFGNQLQLFEREVADGNLTAAMDLYENTLTAAQHITLRSEGATLAVYTGLIQDSLTAQEEKAAFAQIAALPIFSQITAAHKAAVNSAKAAYDALPDASAFTAAVGFSWTENLQACVEIIAAIAPDEGGTPQPGVKSVTVSFRLVGDSVHDSPEQHVRYVDWVRQTSYTFYGVDKVSVYEVFMRAVSDHGLQQEGAETNYVTQIMQGSTGTRLGEFTNGRNSGWMYMVDRVHPDHGLQDFYVTDGQEIVWHYVDDYDVEEYIWEETGYSLGSGTDQAESGAAASAEIKVEAPLDADGKATANVGTADVAKALEQAQAGAEKAGDGTLPHIRIAVTCSQQATALDVGLKAEALKAIANAKGAYLTMESGLGWITLDNAALNGLVSGVPGNADVVLSIARTDAESLEEAARAAVGGNPVYTLAVTVDGKEATRFQSALTVFLPYALPSGTDAGSLTVYHITPEGEARQMQGARYDAQRKGFGFTTTHFSLFMIGPVGDRSGAASPLPFTDIDGHWAYEAIRYAFEHDLMNGVSDTLFAPESNLTRAMLVTVLYRYESEPEVTASNPFSDVIAGEWYTNAILWANANKIADGYGQGLFGTNDHITREQAATILMRYAQWKALDVSNKTPLTAYTDASEISAWALDAMEWANAQGLITGRTAITLAPRGTMTRAEAATILMRMMENVIK